MEEAKEKTTATEVAEQQQKEPQTAAQKSERRWERFEFKLTINDNIICQRYFAIPNFRNDSKYSTDLIDALKRCVYLIDSDLKDKTHIFLELTCPQLLPTYDYMMSWYKTHPVKKNDPPLFVIIEETEQVYVVNNGNPPVLFEKPFNKYEYLPSKTNPETITFKLGMYEFGKEVASVSWDGSVYPKFIRSNVDLSNQKNRYRIEGQFSPVEAYLIDNCNKGKVDIIPIIVRELTEICSYEEDEGYNTSLYGYDLNIYEAEWKYIREIGNIYRKKTDAYFGIKPPQKQNGKRK